jgi:hypothetical protein
MGSIAWRTWLSSSALSKAKEWAYYKEVWLTGDMPRTDGKVTLQEVWDHYERDCPSYLDNKLTHRRWPHNLSNQRRSATLLRKSAARTGGRVVEGARLERGECDIQ